jgi:hypothetical protein
MMSDAGFAEAIVRLEAIILKQQRLVPRVLAKTKVLTFDNFAISGYFFSLKTSCFKD